jgi:hypothetical protein
MKDIMTKFKLIDKSLSFFYKKANLNILFIYILLKVKEILIIKMHRL